jgi:hypothetical protein
MKKKKDTNKKLRDSLDDSLEHKFMVNLQWSMLFFCFNQIANILNEENELEDDKCVQKEFIKNWKKSANINITTNDLKIINDILSSPKNIFHSVLQNDNEIIESTEIYQEKYDIILKNIENFFLKTSGCSDYNSSEEENE